MEDVLRKIYLQKHQQLQKKKLDRKLNLDQPQKRSRLYKNIFQDYLPLVQSFDLQPQLQIKKNIQFGNDFLQQNHRYKVKSVNSPFQTKPFSLPPIRSHRDEIPASEYMTHEELMLQLKNPQRFKARHKQIETEFRRKYVLKRFRIQVSKIIFVIRLSSTRKQTLLMNRQNTKLIAARLLPIIDKMVNKYYAKVLEEQLLKYLELIKIKIQQPKILLEKQILNMLYFMSKKLAESGIIKELMAFLMAISRNGSFLPSDYLTKFEASRLEFNSKFGCIQNVNEGQQKMLIAVSVGLKIFCGNVLFRPWILQIERSPISSQQIIRNYLPLVKLIHGTASIFYHIIMEEFCHKIEPVASFNPKILERHKFELQPYLNIFPKQYEVQIISNKDEIFPNQNKKIFVALSKQNPQTFSEIKQNLVLWIDKIYNAFVKEEQRQRVQRRRNLKEEQKQIIQSIVQRRRGKEEKKEGQSKASGEQSKMGQIDKMELTKRIFGK